MLVASYDRNLPGKFLYVCIINQAQNFDLIQFEFDQNYLMMQPIKAPAIPIIYSPIFD